MSQNKQNIRSLLLGSFLAGPRLIKHYPFLIFVGFLAMLSIFSSHRADQKVHEIARLRKEVKESKAAFISTRSTLMQASRATQVAERVEALGLKMPENPIIELKP